MQPLAREVWSSGYAFHPFKVRTTEFEFPFSRRSTASTSKGSNITALWTPHTQETLVNGVLQGRKQTDLRGASAISRTKIFGKFHEVSSLPGTLDRKEVLKIYSYEDIKKCPVLADRREVKKKAKEEVLNGWDRP